MHAYPAWPWFVAALLALLLKTTATSLLQIATRLRSGSFLVPEDNTALRIRPRGAPPEILQRCTHIWRNDVENLPLFLAVALSFVLAGGSATGGAALFGAFVALRYLHTAVYLLGLQPWRALAYFGGVGVCWAIAARTALLVFG